MVRRSPLGSLEGADALRMAVGQSVSNRVTLALVDAAVWLAGPLRPEAIGGGEIGKHLDMLLRLGQKVWVEAESTTRYGLDPSRLRQGVEMASRHEIERRLLEADAVAIF